MEKINLVFPSMEMELHALNFKREFFDNGEKTINGSYKLDIDKYTYSDWLQVIKDNLSEDTINPRFGLSHTLFAVNDEGEIIGIVNFRHLLTDFYKGAGHIGYSVRPSQRKKGYATEILRQTLGIAKKQGLTEVYLVCKKDNDASKKTIIKNYGSLSRTFKNNEIEYEEYRISF